MFRLVVEQFRSVLTRESPSVPEQLIYPSDRHFLSGVLHPGEEEIYKLHAL